MTNFIKILTVLFFSVVFLGCGPSERELAVQHINDAKTIILAGDTLAAIAKLDSVKILYPNSEVQIGVARNINNELYRQIVNNKKNQLYNNDSLIVEFESKFTKEKTEFDMYEQYIHKRQTFNRSWNRSFLEVHLDERGELYLSSNYMGKEWLNHTGIRVYDGKLQAKTDKVDLDDPLNHRSDFLDYKWEKVSYMNGKSDSVIHFIAEHPDLNLKCVFIGKRYYYILLEDYDIAAVVDALALSEAIIRRKELLLDIDKFSARIK